MSSSPQRRFDPVGVGHAGMVIKNPAKNRAFLRGARAKGRRPAPGAPPATEGYAALVNRLAKSVMLAPKLIVPTGDGGHVGLPHLLPVVERKSGAGRNRRLQKKLEKQRRRAAKLRAEQPPVSDGLFVHRDDNTYLDNDAKISRFALRTTEAAGRMLRRADATGSTFAASKRRGLRPGRPRTVPDPTPAHIGIFLRQRSQAAERKGAEDAAKRARNASGTGTAAGSHAPLVRAIPIDDRDMYTPVREPARAPLSGVWGPGKDDYVRVALDELEVEDGSRTTTRFDDIIQPMSKSVKIVRAALPPRHVRIVR